MSQQVLNVLKNQLNNLHKKGIALNKSFYAENSKDPVSKKTSLLCKQVEALKFAIRDLEHAIYNLERFNSL